MQDMIPMGTGNSRYMKSSVPTGTTWEQALAMLRAGTFPFDLNGINSAGIAQQGTPLNVQTLLQDATAQAIGLTQGDPTPDDAFAKIANVIAQLDSWVSGFSAFEVITQTAPTTSSTTSITVALDGVNWEEYNLIIVINQAASGSAAAEADSSKWCRIQVNGFSYGKYLAVTGTSVSTTSSNGVGIMSQGRSSFMVLPCFKRSDSPVTSFIINAENETRTELYVGSSSTTYTNLSSIRFYGPNTIVAGQYYTILGVK